MNRQAKTIEEYFRYPVTHHATLYELMATGFAEWIAKNKYVIDDEGEWWDVSVNKIVANSTDELLHIFKTQ